MIGFTNNIGSIENNVTVASARARAARAYLTENGVSLKRIAMYGYGEVMFKADNSTDEGRALNRRVEIELK
jgi:OOP family OmpA-OmpF porin